jgi:SWI2/SNF2 ATPase
MPASPTSSASPGRRSRKDDVNTPAVFGEYIHAYDLNRAVEDGTTVPVYCESRLARIELPEDEKPKIHAETEEPTGDEAVIEQEPIKRKRATVGASGCATCDEPGLYTNRPIIEQRKLKCPIFDRRS